MTGCEQMHKLRMLILTLKSFLVQFPRVDDVTLVLFLMDSAAKYKKKFRLVDIANMIVRLPIEWAP